MEAQVWAVEAEVGEDAEVIRAIGREQTGVVRGVGGVRTAQQAWAAVEAGADFVVAAPLDSEIAAVCEAADVATIAEVEDEAGLSEVLPLRPDLVRVPSGLEVLVSDGPDVIVRLSSVEGAAVRDALASGAVAVSVSQRELRGELAQELRWLVDEARRSA